MIISKIFCYIKGFITIIIEGLFPERFINICSLNKIELKNIKRKDSTHIFADIKIGDFKKLHKIHKKANCKIHIQKRYGFLFFIHRHRKRKAFIVGIFLFFVILNILTRFIWTVNITGNTDVSETEILNCLQKAGISTGISIGKVNSSEIQSYLMTNMDKLGFVSVNRIGTTLNIDVREREKPRKHFDRFVPVNIISSQNGVIEKIITKSGTAVVKEGDVVYKGQLLVSSANDSKLYGIKYSHSDAEILGRVWHEKSLPTNYRDTKKVSTGKVKRKKKLLFFNFSVNLFIKNKILFEKYDILSYTKYISLGDGKNLPIGIETTEYREYEENSVNLSEKEIEEKLFFELDKECKDCKVVNKTTKKKDGMITVTYECLEDITQEEELNDSGKISGS